MDYKPLDVKSFDELAEKDFEQIDPLIDHFLPGVGVFLFCGSSKIGKSWLAHWHQAATVSSKCSKKEARNRGA